MSVRDSSSSYQDTWMEMIKDAREETIRSGIELNLSNEDET